MKKAIVFGASGATGKLLVKELLSKNVEVVAVVRKSSSLHTIYSDSLNL